MPTDKPTGATKNLGYQLWRWVKRLPNRLAASLLRLLFWVNRPARLSRAGFVLPTTVLLLLMVSLTVGAMSYRSFTRSSQAIAEREQQVVDNVAAPALDRARAKIEYLFTKDPRFPGGVPSSDVLAAMMLNNGSAGIIASADDPYTLPGETRLNIGGVDSADDNAWSFNTDLNGDGTDETIAYSILMDDEATPPGGTSQNIDDQVSTAKAQALVTRNGPINTAETASGCTASARTPEGGWQVVNQAQLEKNFQINTLVVNSSAANRTVSASEFQQVRQSNRGNKWGAWFRYDLEIFSGPEFNWNGAIHTEGSLITPQQFKAYMLSSPSSCVYSNTNSEITLGQRDDNNDGTPDFQGQIIFGALTKTASGADKFEKGAGVGSNGNKYPKFHIYTSRNEAPNQENNTRLTDDTDDSVASKPNQTPSPSDVALDPIQLFTTGISTHINSTTWKRDPNWANSIFANGNNRRIRNLPDAVIPYLDDGYRADNRYGPKPVYNSQNSLASDASVLGDRIETNPTLNAFSPDATNPSNGNFGLDGYWERRAVAGGLRLIVGQRLELGNMYGWGAANDPLYPPSSVSSHEQRQRRSLRDNLAAVQSMAVYHYKSYGGEYPLACVASTVHPGTFMSLRDSRTFKTYPGTSTLEVNFLNGRGTNGWEFKVPFESNANPEAAFRTAVNDRTSPLGSALRNLAYFAGDPLGGAPSFRPVQDNQVHPYPHFAMWGDFSKLRRIFDDYIDASGSDQVSYQVPRATDPSTDLSLADKSTLHSAACTLGMLSYNLDSLKSASESIISSKGQSVADYVITNFAGDPKVQTLEDWATFLSSQTSPEEFRALALYYQTERDRALGFRGANTKIHDYSLAPTSGAFTAGTYELTCNPDAEFSSISGRDKRLALANIFCSKQAGPKYPALYYLFPTVNHNQRETQPSTEEYIAQAYISNNPVTSGKNKSSAVAYKALSISSIKLDPRDIGAGASSPDSWKLPFRNPTEFNPPTLSNWDSSDPETLRGVFDPDPSTRQPMTISTPAGFFNLALLDKGIMDGREVLNTRVMDMDLDQLFNRGNNGDKWISAVTDGVVYAFREDAVREDSIVRPRAANWGSCNTLATIITSNCRMKATGNNLGNQSGTQDPPLNTDNLISPKPVDFFADPDRRPHGWRLINGKDFNRPSTVLHGITFNSDNPVYIRGDFNWHQDRSSGARLEEFTQKLDDDYDNFYTRSTLDTTFATAEDDKWRPAEIFADGITTQSDNFRDGVIEDGFVYDVGSGDGSPVVDSSFLNFNRPYKSGTDPARKIAFSREQWIRETGGSVPTAISVPIRLNRNGEPDLVSGVGTIEYGRFTDKSQHAANQISAKNNTRINALLIAGIVPSRVEQPYGGMHNFPRLLEHWKSKNLYISGGFFQLNFSTQATAPWDQDAWEPGENPKREENIVFYGAANRLWGYDVGLQYAPSAPIAQRFVTVGQPRSEFFRELPVDDPYIQNLCSALSSC